MDHVRQDNRLVRAFGQKGLIMRLLTATARDSIDELLAGLKVESTVYCLSELQAPWGFRVDGESVAKFHLVLDGGCWLRINGDDPLWLNVGDLVVLPRGEEHAVSDEPETPAPDLERILAGHPLDAEARLFYGGQGSHTRLLCGGFVLAEAVPAALSALLPRLVRVDVTRCAAAGWLEPTFALLRQEADRSTPGARAILAKLADVFLAQALRDVLVEAQRAGLLSGQPSRDAPIAHAIELIRNAPARRWTLASLAHEVGMSRTAFATRFRASVGDSPMRHLAMVRLSLAAGYLRTTKLSLNAVARRAGYDSDASLSKAFKREFGLSPGAYRVRSSPLITTPEPPSVVAARTREM
jgi:AraC-like DNA-binding protein